MHTSVGSPTKPSDGMVSQFNIVGEQESVLCGMDDGYAESDT